MLPPLVDSLLGGSQFSTPNLLSARSLGCLQDVSPSQGLLSLLGELGLVQPAAPQLEAALGPALRSWLPAATAADAAATAGSGGAAPPAGSPPQPFTSTAVAHALGLATPATTRPAVADLGVALTAAGSGSSTLSHMVSETFTWTPGSVELTPAAPLDGLLPLALVKALPSVGALPTPRGQP